MNANLSINVALYLRVSSSRQETENQRRQLVEFCERSGWKVSAIYADTGSGSNTNRPQFQRMLADASKRKFDVLVVWALDRLTREGVAKTLNTIEQLQGWGVQVRSYSESWADTSSPMFELIGSILGWAAKMERGRLIERTMAGLERAKAQGKVLGRPRTTDGKADDVRRLRSEGHSMPVISKELDIGLGSVARILAKG